MKFTFFSQHTKKRAKRKHYIEFNPRRYWVVLLCLFVLGIALELVFFSLVFLNTGKRIDAPANPTLDTNATKIEQMEKTLTEIETAIEARTGKPLASPDAPSASPSN